MHIVVLVGISEEKAILLVRIMDKELDPDYFLSMEESGGRTIIDLCCINKREVPSEAIERTKKIIMQTLQVYNMAIDDPILQCGWTWFEQLQSSLNASGSINHSERERDLIKKTICIMEGDSFNYWQLYYHYENRIKSWKQLSPGYIVECGRLDNRPINIELHWSKLEGHVVAFFKPCSQLVDWLIIDDWLKRNFPKLNGKYFDSFNFNHCMTKIKQENKVEESDE